MEEISERDCCGNGCANCILDTERQKFTQPSYVGKTNILSYYQPYQLLSCEEIKPKILEMHFRCIPETADSNSILHIPAGYHVMMRAPLMPAEASKYVTRPYSPFWSDIHQLEFKILVNLKPDGVMSKYIQHLQPMEQVYFRGPVGSFIHAPTLYENILLFCHGVAIAPTLSIIKEILNDDDDMTRIQLFACFENLENILFRDELHEFNRFWNFRGKIFLSKPEEGFEANLKYQENILGKRLDNVEIEKVIKSCLSLNAIKCVICGSKQFQEYIRYILEDQGVDKSVIDIL